MSLSGSDAARLATILSETLELRLHNGNPRVRIKVIAFIEDPVVIEKILTPLDEKAASVGTGLLPEKFAGARSIALSGFAKGELVQCRCLGGTHASERADHG